MIRRKRPTPQPTLSFGTWDQLSQDSVVQICHPLWRGVRTASYAFRTPVVETADLLAQGSELAALLSERAPRCVVIQGWPSGAARFAGELADAGVKVKCILHSSPVQHDAEAGEAAVVADVLRSLRAGVLDGVGMNKVGVPEAMNRLGFPVAHVPNRAPAISDWRTRDLGPGLQVGVFAEPFWRKNVTTQIMGATLLGGRTHTLKRPDNFYLEAADIVEHGVLPYEAFIDLQASVDINLYVTLSECHPLTPQESYLTGVPCLVSRTSGVFRSDPVLWDLTTVDEADNPSSIAAAASRLLESRDEAVARAVDWISEADAVGEQLWNRFVSD